MTFLSVVRSNYKKLAPIVVSILKISKDSIKDTQKKKSTSNKIPALTKGINVDIWVVGTSKHIFIRGS